MRVRAREHTQARKRLAHGRHVGKIAGAVLDADHGVGIGRQQLLDQAEADRHAGILRNVIQVDPEAVVADTLDDFGIGAEQPVVGDRLVIERRQHQHAGGAHLDRLSGQLHRVGNGAAAGAGDHPVGRDAGDLERIQQTQPFGDAERIGLAGGAEHGQPVAAFGEKPAAVRHEGGVIGTQIGLERGQRGGKDAAGYRSVNIAHGSILIAGKVIELSPNTDRRGNTVYTYSGQRTMRSSGSSSRSSETTRPRTDTPARCTVSGSPETSGCHHGRSRPSEISR